MPTSGSRQKTFCYKRAEVLGAEPRPLSEMLLDALGHEQRPLRRAQRRGEGNEDVRLVNRCYRHHDMICGCLFAFSEGHHQPTIKLDENEIELAIEQIPPREREQFVEGMLFFGVQQQHVVLVQSQSLRSAQLEEHINWLLRERTHVLMENGRVLLRDQPSRDVRRRFEGVKSVSLRAPISLDIFREPAEQTPNTGGVISVVTRQILQSLVSSRSFLEQLSADDALALEDVEISLEIRRKRRTRRGNSLLDELATALRNSDDDMFELETKSGKVLSSGELKLAVTRSVKTQNGMPLLPDVARKMHDWLAELVADRQVSEI